MQETLEKGLAELFGGKPPTPPASTTAAPPASSTPPESATRPSQTSPELTALATEARTHYERAVAAQRSGDWATYGEELRQLGQVLERMRSAR
jgi:uncharacterized membrane protein (UPF0182 family)